MSHPHHPPPSPVQRGHVPVARIDSPSSDAALAFGLIRLGPRECYAPQTTGEGALVLLDGEVDLAWGAASSRRRRGSLFDEEPVVLHYPAGTAVRVTAITGAELALCETASDGVFEPVLFDASSLVESEHRGRGLLENTAYRIVRTVFDRRNRPNAALVLGEVVSFPGRWSSYPPHHHRQPEIYHYRFTEPQGYGHGELGDEVFKIRHGDTLEIRADQDHAQVAAPGYGMYYLWVIRHLPGDPYTVPEFSAEHRWLLEPDAPVWRARGLGPRPDDGRTT